MCFWDITACSSNFINFQNNGTFPIRTFNKKNRGNILHILQKAKTKRENKKQHFTKESFNFFLGSF